jgi:hypothetical protein
VALVNVARSNASDKGASMMKAGTTTILVATSILAATLGGAINCGGVSKSDVDSARAQATTASCNYYQMCKLIGPKLQGGDTYADCMTMVLGQWTSGWPTTTCQGHIDQHALTVCVDAINSTTDCNNLAALITLSKCSEASVCGAGATDGSTD